MSFRSDFCPGCGAQVYPEEVHCPFCGRKLHSDYLTPILIGVGGAVVAAISGGLVWWVMSAPVPDTAVQQAAEQPAATAPPQVTASVPAGQPPSASGKDQQAFTPSAGTRQQTASLPYAPANPAESQLPLPHVVNPPPTPAGDAASRKAFAKAKQDSFVQNGLDLTVATSGEDATTITIRFNFPAKTAAELIVAGPFPKQCEQRGFRQIIFMDPSGASWNYDMASAQLTQR